MYFQAGKKAAGPTTKEFAEQVMKPMLDAAKALAKEPAHKDIFKTYKHCMFSYDNPKIHTGAWAMLKAMGINEDWKVPLSPYSPDLHRVIEHLHGIAEAAFKRWMYEHPQTHSLQKYKTEFKRIFAECCKPESIAADVQGLPELYKWVAAHKGDWAPRKMR